MAKVDGQYTLEEVAQELGVSRSRAYQIEQAALRKLKKGLMERGYTVADILPEGGSVDTGLHDFLDTEGE